MGSSQELFRGKALPLLLAALSLFVAGCASRDAFYNTVDARVAEGRYLDAIQGVRQNESSYGDKSTVLYNLDMGLLFHYAGEPDSSIPYFFAAERQMEELYTKSISQQALSLLLNDNILPYGGEDHEKVLLNVFLALDYAEQGNAEDALVEARKVDLKLREYSRAYDGKNTYQEDAFIRYISGALYESDGELNDAFIAYRKAYEAYQAQSQLYDTPPMSFLLDDLVRTARLMSFDEEAAQYESLGGKPFDRQADQGLGSLVVVVYSGKSPVKVQERSSVSIPDSSGTLHTFQVALPVFVPRHLTPRTYTVEATSSTDTMQGQAELSENLTAISKKALEDRIGLIYLKSGGRALLKFLASEKIKSGMKSDGSDATRNFLGSLAVDLVFGATEQADVRSWRTLPAEVHLARMDLVPGDYDVRVGLSGGSGDLKRASVQVRRGKVTFIMVNDVR